MKRVSFKKSLLEQWAKEKKFDQMCKEEEDRRCASDLMYSIFKRPEEYVPQLYPRLIELIEKKYAPDLLKSRVFRDLHGNPPSDVTIQTFYSLLIIAREEEAQDVIQSAYGPDSLWGDKSSRRFQNEYLPVLRAMIDQAFNEPFGQVNIVDIVTWLVCEAEQLYMRK